MFFVDIEGHEQDPPVRRALAELKRRASLFRVLGSYPARGRLSVPSMDPTRTGS